MRGCQRMASPASVPSEARMSFVRSTSPLIAIMVLAIAAGSDAADAEAVHYWNGQQRVEMVLALDELQVDAAAADAGKAVGAMGRLMERKAVKGGQPGRARLHLRFTGLDRAERDRQARAVV